MLPAFSFSFDGLIWRVIPDLHKPYLILEIRHSSHKVLFAAVDIHQKTLMWTNWSPSERWWSSGVAADRGILFLQIFPDGQNPNPRGIIALNIETQQICWEQIELQFMQLASDGSVLTRRIKEALPEYFTLDALSGKIIQQSDAPLFPASVPSSSSIFPVHYTSEDDYFQIIAEFLSKTLKILPKNALEYAETKHSIIISYYIYAEDQVENYLVVFDIHSRVPLLHEKIATQRTGIGKGTFFVFEQLLIFIKEQTLLLGYEI
ncbi:DUF4905 domain-containing protein [Cytophagaceae bacterium DM2B3-1]|uniref:DUF4905 domain-containing protein n=1 Tax=Xanthocytophaga flava TaxID=3048013 RepID=A0ABT7CW28_9BACT|nr:DUF4905 domain-containing protein [Xanthocytophaga flavus]MDJ1497986.1 DUF4905 domain-containing protein [Xanthocytophaga flavus]